MKVVAILPAHNEAGNIADAILSLQIAKREGAIFDFVVVANGCTDKTAEVASGMGAKVISLPEANKGKAFIQGVHFANKLGAGVVFTADADADKFGSANVRAIVEPVLKGEAKMALSEFHYPKAGISFPANYTGFRAIAMSSLKPILAGNATWIHALTSTPYSLERGLNTKIFGHPDIDTLELLHQEQMTKEKQKTLRQTKEWRDGDNILGVQRKGETKRALILDAGFIVKRNIRDHGKIGESNKQTTQYFIGRIERLKQQLQMRKNFLPSKVRNQMQKSLHKK